MVRAARDRSTTSRGAVSRCCHPENEAGVDRAVHDDHPWLAQRGRPGARRRPDRASKCYQPRLRRIGIDHHARRPNRRARAARECGRSAVPLWSRPIVGDGEFRAAIQLRPHHHVENSATVTVRMTMVLCLWRCRRRRDDGPGSGGPHAADLHQPMVCPVQANAVCAGRPSTWLLGRDSGSYHWPA